MFSARATKPIMLSSVIPRSADLNRLDFTTKDLMLISLRSFEVSMNLISRRYGLSMRSFMSCSKSAVPFAFAIRNIRGKLLFSTTVGYGSISLDEMMRIVELSISSPLRYVPFCQTLLKGAFPQPIRWNHLTRTYRLRNSRQDPSIRYLITNASAPLMANRRRYVDSRPVSGLWRFSRGGELYQKLEEA